MKMGAFFTPLECSLDALSGERGNYALFSFINLLEINCYGGLRKNFRFFHSPLYAAVMGGGIKLSGSFQMDLLGFGLFSYVNALKGAFCMHA